MMGYENPYDFDYSPVPRRKNPTAKRAMKLASKLRAQGADPSSALSEAWSEVRGKNPRKGGDAMEDLFDLSNPMNIAILAGGGCLIYYLVAKKWPWQSVAMAPVSRQLGVGRRPIVRPNVTRPGMAQPTHRSSIGDITTLSQGGPLPSGSYSETISIIGR